MSCNFMQQQQQQTRPQDTQSEASESGTTNSGWTSNWDSREDLRDFVVKIGLKDASDLHQDRFRVDRKKLEQMLCGDDEAPLPADTFFEQIMDDTSTFIRWPSKLKVGAKSKKDPHVRIAGRPEDVQAAKERIMTVLDTRCNRVTMKIDVSYTDHSHIIGKGGHSIKRVMEETQCHVHFPDSNRSNPNEKSNQVSIAGDIQGVELARSRVRQKTPLIFSFELPIMSSNVDPTSAYIVKIQEEFHVQVIFRTRPKLHATLVLVKGVEWEVAQAKRATMLLVDYLCENLANQIPIQISLEISPHHHQMVTGKNYSNIKEIMRLTGAQIMFTDAQDPNIPSLKKSNVTITGNINNVYSARQHLIGSLPLLLMFDLPENSSNLATRPQQIAEIQSKFDVVINIRLKAKQSAMGCIIKGAEKNAVNIYQARNEILGIDEPAIPADIPDSYHLPPAPSTPQELPTPTPLNPQSMSPLLSPLISPTWAFPSTSFAQPQPPFLRVMQQQQFVFGSSVPNSVSSSGYLSGQYSGSTSLEHSRENSSYSSMSGASSMNPSPTGSPKAGGYRCRSPAEKVEFASVLSEMNVPGGYHGPTIEKRKERSASLADYDEKKLAGYKAMQALPTGPCTRYPTSSWSGYGISHTSTSPFTSSPNASAQPADDNILELAKDYLTKACFNSSDYLDHTTPSFLNRVTSSKWPDLGTLLTSLGLEKYIGLLASHEIDLTAFASITDKDLLELGIKAFGARRKMLLAISELNKRARQFSPAPGAERKYSSTSSSGSNCSPREKW